MAYAPAQLYALTRGAAEMTRFPDFGPGRYKLRHQGRLLKTMPTKPESPYKAGTGLSKAAARDVIKF